MRGINLNFFNLTTLTQSQDTPVKAGCTTALGFPAITHIDATPRINQITWMTKVRITIGNDTTAIFQSDQINHLIAVLNLNFYFTIDFKASYTPVRENI